MPEKKIKLVNLSEILSTVLKEIRETYPDSEEGEYLSQRAVLIKVGKENVIGVVYYCNNTLILEERLLGKDSSKSVYHSTAMFDMFEGISELYTNNCKFEYVK
jgi:hypothetical protein